MFNIGFSEFILIGIIALIFIGPQQLPELARTLGRFFADLKKASDDITGTMTGFRDQANSMVRDTPKEMSAGVEKKPPTSTPSDENKTTDQMSFDLSQSTEIAKPVPPGNEDPLAHLDEAHRNNPHFVHSTADTERIRNRDKKEKS